MQKHIENYANHLWSQGKYIENTPCENCGSAPHDIHHIVYRSEAPSHEMLDDPVNLILVCRKCHDWLHANKNNRKELVIQRGLELIFKKQLYDRDIDKTIISE